MTVIDSYRTVLDLFVETLTDIYHETLKTLERNIGDEIILNTVNAKETIVSKNTCNYDPIWDIKKNDFPDTLGKLEEALNVYLCEIDQKNLATENLDKYSYFSKKLAYP